jgi:hypothetical protein
VTVGDILWAKYCKCGHPVLRKQVGYPNPDPSMHGISSGTYTDPIRWVRDWKSVGCEHGTFTWIHLCPKCGRKLGMSGFSLPGEDCPCWHGPVRKLVERIKEVFRG